MVYHDEMKSIYVYIKVFILHKSSMNKPQQKCVFLRAFGIFCLYRLTKIYDTWLKYLSFQWSNDFNIFEISKKNEQENSNNLECCPRYFINVLSMSKEFTVT